MRALAFPLQSVASMLAVILVMAGAAHAETVTWTGAVSSDWFVAGNWEPAVVPGAGDTAVITSGSAVLSGNATVAKLTLHAGAVDGAGTLIVDQAMEWTGGVVGVRLRIPAGAMLEIKAGTNKFLNAGTITNAGTAVWTGGDPLHFQNAAQWLNASTGVLKVQGGGRCLTHLGATGSFINDGTVQQEGGGALTFEDIAFTNVGRVECSSGSIHFSCDLAGTGTFFAGAGASNLFTRTVGLTNVVFSGQGTNDLAGATVTLTGDIQSTNLGWNGGVLNGTHTLHGAMTWYAGVWRGEATLAVDAVVTISQGGDKFLAGGVIRNQGTVEWKTWQHLNIQDGAQWINEPGSVFSIMENGTYAQNAGALGSFVNYGTVRKLGDGGTAGFIGIPLVNHGTLELFAGTLYMNGDYVHSEDAVLRTHLRGPGAPADFGRLEVAGTIQLAGDLEVKFVDGYVPSTDSDYRVIAAGRVEGVFSDFTSDLTGLNLYLNPLYSLAGVRLPMVEPTAWFADNGWRGPDGSFHVEIHGVASQSYRIDTSADLKAWGPLTTMVMPASTTFEFVDPPSAGRPLRYYRVVFVPGP